MHGCEIIFSDLLWSKPGFDDEWVQEWYEFKIDLLVIIGHGSGTGFMALDPSSFQFISDKGVNREILEEYSPN